MQDNQTITIIICIFVIVGVLIWLFLCPPWNSRRGRAASPPRDLEGQQSSAGTPSQRHQAQTRQPSGSQTPRNPSLHVRIQSLPPAKQSSPVSGPRKAGPRVAGPQQVGAAKPLKSILKKAKPLPAKKSNQKPPSV